MHLNLYRHPIRTEDGSGSISTGCSVFAEFCSSFSSLLSTHLLTTYYGKTGLKDFFYNFRDSSNLLNQSEVTSFV